MPIGGHPGSNWNGYEAASAHEEQIYDIQNLIMEAEIKEDMVALRGLKATYVFIVSRGKHDTNTL